MKGSQLCKFDRFNHNVCRLCIALYKHTSKISALVSPLYTAPAYSIPKPDVNIMVITVFIIKNFYLDIKATSKTLAFYKHHKNRFRNNDFFFNF